jgi:large subunit ribosomal protein L3
MINAIYGTKVGMTQIFDENGHVIPVTVIEAAPNTVCQIKTTETDGYEAVQLGFGTIKENNVNKPMGGHFAKHGVSPMRHLREVRVDSASEHELGEKVTVANFAEVKKVDVTGTSKGKGFAGVMRRYNFGGGPGGHGAHFHRAPGSIGQCASPSRVFKGVRLPGHMGCDTITTKNLEVVRVDEDMNLILLKGSVPGGKNGVVRIRMA